MAFLVFVFFLLLHLKRCRKEVLMMISKYESPFKYTKSVYKMVLRREFRWQFEKNEVMQRYIIINFHIFVDREFSFLMSNDHRQI
jgi:hypothetical protein